MFYQARSNEKLAPGKVYVVNCWQENVTITLGKVSEAGGKYALMAIDQAIADIRSGWIDGLVTAPIHKKSMQLAGFAHAGHTDYLAEQLHTHEYLMMMISGPIPLKSPIVMAILIRFDPLLPIFIKS